MTYKFILVDRQTRRLACCYVPLVWMNGHAAKENNKPCINIVQRLNVCLYWKVHLAYPAIYRHFTKIILKQRIQINSKNITGLQPPPHRSQQVDWLRAWPWIWTREDREQVQQVARVECESGTAGLQVQHAGHAASILVIPFSIKEWTA